MSDDSTPTLIIRRLEGPEEQEREALDELRAGLAGSPKELQPKLLYDGHGSELFERITRQPEYYPTRSEAEILEQHAPAIMERYRPEELFEIGSGSSRKTRALLEAMLEHGGSRYVPFDVSDDAVRAAADVLCRDYAELEVRGVVGDFHTDLHAVPHPGRRVVAFLGSTIGNLMESERRAFLKQVHSLLRPGDALLLGFDLVKDREALEAAYNDAAGVTREFIRNVLVVLNRDYGADFDPERFRYRGTWDAAARRMDIGLVATAAMTVRIEALDLTLDFERGEYLRVEVSGKFSPSDVGAELRAAGLEPVQFLFDRARRFGLAVAEPSAVPTTRTGSGTAD
ncbi:L-histidine N(alpha)-methyltransferase [Engelhardtia mirabilis]|uniref:Histidine-specific methyltransferase EgtD n=1 Tax=Engelhardtia mirabilis TaxID=2528011 RepID=A0A518BHU8_9BACT|nr:Histidine-specific methyltransferase EgtD [Planctomycetes bacterium Pla133]QDV00886.1 Histidine-specific methyltransferase EgtD [Planctomycetes bacterium Pla86]